MSANVSMKFTLYNNNNNITRGQTLNQIRNITQSNVISSSKSTVSKFSMQNLGRSPQLQLNRLGKSSVGNSQGRGCGCCG